MGSRYGGLKQMDPVGPGGTIMDYSVYDAARAGFGDVVFVIRPDIEAAFADLVATRCARRLPTSFVHQVLSDLPAGHVVPEGRTKPWGTGHAVHAARRVVKGPFAVINADDFYGRGTFESLAAFLAAPRPESESGDDRIPTLRHPGRERRGLARRLPRREGAPREHHRNPRPPARRRCRLGARPRRTGATRAGDAGFDEHVGLFHVRLPVLEAGFTRFLEGEGGAGKGEFGLPPRFNRRWKPVGRPSTCCPAPKNGAA
jgi:hypothetical protein